MTPRRLFVLKVAMMALAIKVCSSGACAWQGLSGQVQPGTDHRLERMSLVHDGLLRYYSVARPSDRDLSRTHPAILLLHGGGGNIENLMEALGRKLLEHGLKNGVMLVLPEAVGTNWNDGRDFTEAKHEGRLINDTGFIEALICRLIERESVNPRRVYIAGVSNGGMMCMRLALELPGRFAGMASVIASLPRELYEKYDTDVATGQAMDILLISATSDPLIPWEGGAVRLPGGQIRGAVVSAEATRNFWLRRHGMPLRPEARELLPVTDSDRIISSKRIVYRNRITGYRLHFYMLKNAGHHVPVLARKWGRPVRQALLERVAGKSCHDFETADVIWNFFF